MRELLNSDAGSPAPVTHGGASSAMRGRGKAAAAAGGLAAVIVIAVGAAMGFWFVPFIAGLAIGLMTRRGRLRMVLSASAAVTVAGWAAPLAWQAGRGEPVGATARTVAALAGLPASAALILGVTLLVAAVQGITGVWLARAIGTRERPNPPRPSVWPPDGAARS